MVLLALNNVTKVITIIVTYLQGLNTLLNQQKVKLKGLIQFLVDLYKVQGPHNIKTLTMAYNILNLVICESRYIALTSMEAFIQNQSTFVMRLMALLYVDEAKIVVCNMVVLFARLLNGIASIVI